MAKITASVYTSHVPAIGAALDLGKTAEPYWQKVFAGYEFSKQQFLRSLSDRNPVPQLDELEQEILQTANELGIGPMGFGGKTTLLGVKICAANRLPASFFVSVSYMCWAYRRQGIRLDNAFSIAQWLY